MTTYFTLNCSQTNQPPVLWPLYSSTCVSKHLQLRTAEFCWCSFTAHMPLLMATSMFGLERRRWNSPQQCYLHCLHSPYLTCSQIWFQINGNKKLSYRRGTARCVLSVVILPIATQQCRNYLYDKS